MSSSPLHHCSISSPTSIIKAVCMDPIAYHPCLPCRLPTQLHPPFPPHHPRWHPGHNLPTPTSLFTKLPPRQPPCSQSSLPQKPTPQPQSQSTSPSHPRAPLLRIHRMPLRQQTHIRPQPHMPSNHHRRVVMDTHARVSVKLPPDARVDADKTPNGESMAGERF